MGVYKTFFVSHGVWLELREEDVRGGKYRRATVVTPRAWAGDIIFEVRPRPTRSGYKSYINRYTHSKGMPRVHLCGKSLAPHSSYFCAEPLYKISDMSDESFIIEQIKRFKNMNALFAVSPEAMVPNVCPQSACPGKTVVINYDYSAIYEICDNIGAQETLEKCRDGSAKRWKTCIPPGYWVEDEKICEFMGCPDYNVKHGETFCKDFDLYRCEDGSHILVETNSKDCGYVAECTERETRNETYCPDGVTKKSWEECVSGEWITKTGVCGCVSGTTSCQGYNLYTCVDGEWVLKERNSEECGYTENGKIGILDPIVSWIEISFDVDRKTAEMYAYIGIAGIGAVVVLGVMSK